MGAIAPAEPAFRRVARDLRTQILEKNFADDVALPTEAEIATEYGVCRQTVRRAFQDLVAEGLVFRVRGRGTFATPPAAGRYLRQFGSIEDLMALSADSELRVVTPLAPGIDPAAASRLQLPDDHVFTVSFLRLHDGLAFCHTQVFLPPPVRAYLGMAKELSTARKVSWVTVIGLLDQVLPASIQDADQSISVGSPAPEVAESLGVTPQSALLRIDRTYFDTNSEPVELAVSHFLPERYSYRVRLRRSIS